MFTSILFLLIYTANKIYVQKKYSVKKSFNDIAVKSFASEAQNLDFSNSKQSASIINEWVEKQTNDKIKNLISSESLDSDTRMVLVNAIYFQAFWLHRFEYTYQDRFYLNDLDSVQTDFMNIQKQFNYGILPSLDASAVELPYKDSTCSMLIILPNMRTGLSALEAKLNTINLNEIFVKLDMKTDFVMIPKFKIDFDIQLNESLKNVS